MGKGLVFIILAGFLASGCVPGAYAPEMKKTRIDKGITGVELPEGWELLNLYPNIKPEEFAKEIARLESVVGQIRIPSTRAKVHLRLGLLYLDKKNPDANYFSAAKELESYVALDPKGDRREEVMNLIGLLGEMRRLAEESKKTKAKMDQLIQEMERESREVKKENQEIKKEAGELKKTVDQLKDQVEQLKSLDINIEQRRKRIK